MPKISSLHAAIDDVFRDSTTERRNDIFGDLCYRYKQSHRHHHGLFHIADIVERLDAFDVPNPRAAKAAALYHDVFYYINAYTPGYVGPSNERRSSDYAQHLMQAERVPAEITRRASDLILMTEKHNVPDGDAEAALFMDLDMRVLGADLVEYEQYAVNTAAEFLTYFAPQDYISGRTRFLVDMHGRDRIFLSTVFAPNDVIARQNMVREIENIDQIVALALSRRAQQAKRQPTPERS